VTRHSKSRCKVKIQTIPISPAAVGAAKVDSEAVRLKVSGPVDPNDAVMRHARKLVLDTGSQTMIESFDWAVRHGNLVTEE
jgi:hypothetical protein